MRFKIKKYGVYILRFWLFFSSVFVGLMLTWYDVGQDAYALVGLMLTWYDVGQDAYALPMERSTWRSEPFSQRFLTFFFCCFKLLVVRFFA